MADASDEFAGFVECGQGRDQIFMGLGECRSSFVENVFSLLGCELAAGRIGEQGFTALFLGKHLDAVGFENLELLQTAMTVISVDDVICVLQLDEFHDDGDEIGADGPDTGLQILVFRIAQRGAKS